MPTFTYEAKDASGTSVAGIIEAIDERGAATALREQGLLTMRIAAMRNPGAPQGAYTQSAASPRLSASNAYNQPERIDAAPFLVSAPLPQLAILFRQLATLLNAGVPMVQILTTLEEQTRHPRLKEILAEMAKSAAVGNPMTVVMNRYPSVFSQFQLEMVRAGEASGMLAIMCSRLADYLEREIEIRRKLQRETLYPKIVLFVAGCVLLLLGYLKSGEKGVIGPLEFTGEVGIAGGLIWWLVRYLNQYPGFGAKWDEIKMLIPGTGWVSRKYATARFCRALGTLYSAGVLLPIAVGISARACGNRAIGQRLQESMNAMLQGKGLAGMLEESGLLSPIAVQMARTGEQTGSVDAMMEKVADYLESEADTQAQQMAKFAGVAALILAAVVVGSIVISFYSGMLQQTMSAGEGG